MHTVDSKAGGPITPAPQSGDGSTGKNMEYVPGCTPMTGKVEGGAIVSPAAGMVKDLKG